MTTTIDPTDLIERTRRVPALPATDGVVGGPTAPMIARQLDAALLSVGFTCSQALLANLAAADAEAAMNRAVEVLAAARRMVGDHVRHNAYFRNFPLGVPATEEFWARCLSEAIGAGAPVTGLPVALVNLLDLPAYGRYQHTFDDLLAAHDELIAAAGDRLTVLHLGGRAEDEAAQALRDLLGSTTPLTDGQREMLGDLVTLAPDLTAPESVPVAENRAIVDAARMAHGLPPVLARTITDVLRVAAAASGADVTLTTAPRFVSLPRCSRRALLSTLDRIVTENPSALADIASRAEMWKRLGERLHPHEYPQRVGAVQVFEVARGELWVPSLIAKAERFAVDEPAKSASALASMPGLLARWTDRLVRVCLPGSDDYAVVMREFEKAAPRMSGRVLCSLRDHLGNREQRIPRRIFVNRSGRARAFPDERPTLAPEAVQTLTAVIDAELASRAPTVERLVIDPAVLDVALPLSGKATTDGFSILPRGTTMPLPAGDSLRFFTYWREAERRTDFDLSLLMLDDKFENAGHVSWTRLSGGDGGPVHSGDIVESRNGATEFIDVPLASARCAYLVPQVNIYTGEGFDEVAESLFGYMTRDGAQAGMPFEPRTVRARSEMRGPGRVALPVAFGRNPDGGWSATWLHLTLRGHPSMNTVEGNRVTTSDLARSIIGRRYLTVRHLVDMMTAKAGKVIAPADVDPSGPPVTYVGMERPENLPDGSTAIVLDNLNQLVPA